MIEIDFLCSGDGIMSLCDGLSTESTLQSCLDDNDSCNVMRPTALVTVSPNDDGSFVMHLDENFIVLLLPYWNELSISATCCWIICRSVSSKGLLHRVTLCQFPALLQEMQKGNPHQCGPAKNGREQRSKRLTR